MNEQLNYAPCSYLLLAENGRILDANFMLLQLLEFEMSELKEKSIQSLLTVPSQTFYQLFVLPIVEMEESVEEVYISLKSKTGREVPVIMNAIKQLNDGGITISCAMIAIKKRREYEKVLLAAKKEAEERNIAKKKAIQELNGLRKELENKQQELIGMNTMLQELAMTDELTGLHNRRGYSEKMVECISQFNKTGNPFSLLIIDIDHFKKVNDTFGHPIGDQVLKTISQMIQEKIGGEDVAARIGGEEFAVILGEANQREALEVAEILREYVASSLWTIPTVTISIGVATATMDVTEQSIQARADEALYVSKEKGRNMVTHAAEIYM
ncbi:sensor domain-containing diguanylate cyclase [Rummeliibacillus stabekisii]|uniref:GGDEF domain-containing protein n=1 Tax=Rummeliibacillus stabekisii TaxID=241244 RepID=UPI0020406D1B|nr:sensor domain-containing diguanylate cyclase [Rummeliibacillus stabekisii]MCM3317851.1 sensor domain-containing diguanylate cyclase [Rummeliibacillus stabekisii]